MADSLAPRRARSGWGGGEAGLLGGGDISTPRQKPGSRSVICATDMARKWGPERPPLHRPFLNMVAVKRQIERLIGSASLYET